MCTLNDKASKNWGHGAKFEPYTNTIAYVDAPISKIPSTNVFIIPLPKCVFDCVPLSSTWIVH